MARHDDPKLTTTEKARIAVLVGRMCKRHIAGPDVHQRDLERRVDRILDGARERDKKNARQ
ncbi:DUF6257 family protein [Streptomyces natalensis]|uniref:Uncharacterized protein n=1 Tax=Streptomyces natalensis ATCC 27448 TaxID=1240678 RepID=A0A0D7CQZ3_9ACTN|nr:DUF6257 family protein [Streptomyces natalensis]KIZ18648.1 hypothetical protein SNA_08625 [Streptomyces natalensis ATCC 27448]